MNDSDADGLSRREFVRLVGLTGAGAALGLSVAEASHAEAQVERAGTYAAAQGEWTFARMDAQNSGHQSLGGRIRHPAIAARHYLGGSINWILCEDIDGDGQNELVSVQGGGLVVTDARLRTKWSALRLNIEDVAAVEDVDGDGVKEVLAYSYETVFLLSAHTGQVLWQQTFSDDVSYYRTRIARLDTNLNGQQLLVWPDRSASGYCYAFDRGVENGYLLWTSDPVPQTAEGYTPEVAIGDVNGDGKSEIVIATYGRVLAFDGVTGRAGAAAFGSWGSEVDWISGPNVNGRNYGILYLADLDGDGRLEIVIIADSVCEHIAVIQNDVSGLSLAWDMFIEFTEPVSLKTLRSTLNSLADVDGDGRLEIVVSLFNGNGDGRWHLLVADALAGFAKPKLDLVDRYLSGVQDVDGDGVGEILVSRELGRSPTDYADLEVIKLRSSGSFGIVWSAANAAFVVDKHVPEANQVSTDARSARQEILRGALHSSVPPAFFVARADVVTGYEHDSGAFRKAWRGKVDNLVFAGALDAGASHLRTISFSDRGIITVSALDGAVLAATRLAGFDGMPTAADIDGDSRNEILVTAYGSTRVLRLGKGGRVSEVWRHEGVGLRTLNNPQISHRPVQTYSVAAYDIDGDGRKELLVTDSPRGHSRLVLLDDAGNPIWTHLFDDMPPNDVESGVYLWAAGHVRSKKTLDVFVAGFHGGFETQCSRILDGRTGALLWGLDVLDGRPFAPKSGYPAIYAGANSGLDEIILLAEDELFAILGAGRQVKLLRDRNTPYGNDAKGLNHTPVITRLTAGTEPVMVMSAGYSGMQIVKFDGSTIWFVDTAPWEMFGRQPGVADVDGDGVKEVGVSHADGRFQSLDGMSGQPKWTYSLSAAALNIATCDIDGNGRVDYVFGTVDGHVVALDGSETSAQRILWQLDLRALAGDVALADVDGDGESEVLVTAGDGYLYVIDDASISTLVTSVLYLHHDGQLRAAGLGMRLRESLAKVERALGPGHVADARGHLRSFISLVSSLTMAQIDATARGRLLEDARYVLTSLAPD